MTSFGKVLDLLEQGYLNLQDVVGNVEPLPSLVPYEDYTTSILVYRMDANHEILMGLLHGYTARESQRLSQELWTWFVQWEVDANSAPAPLSKKIRLDDAESQTRINDDQKQRRGPVIDTFERCVIDSKLFEHEEMLRTLIDIVQVESSMVPNFIEFLYRWTDFYDGDGKALKAALKWEIPSLWDFEYHPHLLPEDLKKMNERHKIMAAEERKLMLANAGQAGHIDKAAMPDNTEESTEASPKPIVREKPDLAAMERKMEESERLRYREVKYGIQPLRLDTALPPLVNVPRNPYKRHKYYAACFRSRQRALVLLLEAGLTLKQIGSYQRLQGGNVRDTPIDGVSDDTRKMPGLRHYHKDADFAQVYFQEKEKSRAQREKQAEAGISEDLASEAQKAAQSSAAAEGPRDPLVPPTPSNSHRRNMAADMLARIRAARGKGGERINFVPTPLVGMMKARLFEDARDRRLMVANKLEQTQGHQPRGLGLEEHEEMDSDSGSDGGGDSDNNSDGDDGASLIVSTTSDFTPFQAFGHTPSAGAHLSAAFPHATFDTTATIASAPLPSQLPSSAALGGHLQNPSREEAHHLAPVLHQNILQDLYSRITSQAARDSTPRPGNAVPGAVTPGFEPFPPHMRQIAGRGGMSSSRGSTLNAGMPASTSQSQSAFLPMLSAPDRPPTTMVVPEVRRPTLPFAPSAFQSYTHAAPSEAGQPYFQQNRVVHAQNGPFASSQPRPTPHYIMPSHQQNQQATQSQGIFSQPPQITRTTQVIRPTTPMPQLPPLPQLPGRQQGPNHVVTSPVQPDFSTVQGNSTASLPTPTPSSSGTFAPPLSSNPFMSFENFLAVQRQQAAQAQGQAGLSQSPSTAQNTDILHSLGAPTRQRQMSAGREQEGDDGNPSGASSRPSTMLPTSRPSVPSIMISAAPPRPGLLQVPTLSSAGAHPYETLSTPRPTLQRTTAPTPLSLAPPPISPLTSLAPSILCTTPFQLSHPTKTPILIYFPRIVTPGLPPAFPLGDNHSTHTDAFLLGYTHESTGAIDLDKALFMPTGCWANVLGKVQRHKWTVMETYQSPAHPKLAHLRPQPAKNPREGKMTPHRAAYTKLATAMGLMQTASPGEREECVTKRWRATRGPMRARERGAVWEGWGLVVDRGVSMSVEEREGALVFGRSSGEEEEEMMDEDEMEFDWDE